MTDIKEFVSTQEFEFFMRKVRTRPETLTREDGETFRLLRLKVGSVDLEVFEAKWKNPKAEI
jgi:hypothetical protein